MYKIKININNKITLLNSNQPVTYTTIMYRIYRLSHPWNHPTKRTRALSLI